MNSKTYADAGSRNRCRRGPRSRGIRRQIIAEIQKREADVGDLPDVEVKSVEARGIGCSCRREKAG